MEFFFLNENHTWPTLLLLFFSSWNKGKILFNLSVQQTESTDQAATDELIIPLNKSPYNRRIKRQSWKCRSSRCYWAGITWNVTIREFWSWKQRLENFPFNNWSQCWHHGSTYGCFFEISTIWRVFFKVEIVKDRVAIFFSKCAYIPHNRQNHSNFPPISIKVNLKKEISPEVPGERMVIFEVIEVGRRRPLGKFGSNFFSLSIHFCH